VFTAAIDDHFLNEGVLKGFEKCRHRNGFGSADTEPPSSSVSSGVDPSICRNGKQRLLSFGQLDGSQGGKSLANGWSFDFGAFNIR